MIRLRWMLIYTAVWFAAAPVFADDRDHEAHELSYGGSCRFVEEAAYINRVSIEVLTRLIWAESRFQADALSLAGARGISQFMPGTAAERGLLDPFDPRLAIPEAARFLADLDRRFGNIGLAVAAYNAGPGRISKWLTSNATLPRETAAFVVAVTGIRAEEWVALGPELPEVPAARQSCMTLKASLQDFGFGPGNARPGMATSTLHQSLYMLPILKNSGLMQPGVERSGRMLPSMRDSGQMLPSLRQSGRMLAAMMESRGALSQPAVKASRLRPSTHNQ